MNHGRSAATRPIAIAVSVGATLAWLYFVVCQKVIGPLSADELFFAHIFWMQGQGLRPYVDFNSQHFPTYFELLQPLLPTAGVSLKFIYVLRALSAVILLCYFALLWNISKTVKRVAGGNSTGLFFGLAPVLFVIINNTCLLEIRPDSVAILLESLAWWLLIRSELEADDERRAASLTLASGIAAATAPLFAVRTLIILAVFALTYLALVFTGSNPTRRRAVVAGLVAVSVLYGGGYLLLRDLVDRAIWFALLVPSGAHGFGLAARFFAVLTFPILVLLVIAGAAMIVASLRAPASFRRPVIAAAACLAAGVLLILVDPAPFEYSFGHAVVGILFGLALAPGLLVRKDHDHALTIATGMYGLIGLAGIALLFGTYLAFPLMKHRPAPGFLDFAVHRKPSAHELAAASTRQLLDELVRTERPTSIGEQIDIREELCRRLSGPVLATFYAHPVCIKDASFYWFQLSWPAAYEDQPRLRNERQDRVSKSDLKRILVRQRPSIFVWTNLNRDGSESRRLAPWVGPVLARSYDVRRGYAILRSSTP